MALKGTWVTDTVRVLPLTAESSLLLLHAEGGVYSYRIFLSLIGNFPVVECALPHFKQPRTYASTQKSQRAHTIYYFGLGNSLSTGTITPGKLSHDP